MEPVKNIDVSCKLSKEVYQLKWKVNGFNLIPLVRDHPVFGPSIRLGKQVDSTWQLLMAKQRDDEDKIPSLGFKLVKTEDNTVWDVCRYDITIMDETGKLNLKIADNALAGGEEDLPYKFVKGVPEEVYMNEDGKQQPDDDSPVKGGRVCEEVSDSGKLLQSLFKEEVVTVVCNIRYVYMTDSPDEPADAPEERLLVNDLRQLLKSQKFSDVLLVAGNKEFYAHKNVLCSRTFGFDVMFQEKDQLAKTRIEVKFPAPAVELMLLYLYGGEFPDKLGVSEYYDLYKVSEEYGVNRLKELCTKVLKDMAKDEPSCKDCDSEEEAFLKLVESTKMVVDVQIEGKQEKDVPKAASTADAPASSPANVLDDVATDKKKCC